jgi:hypothetical protein
MAALKVTRLLQNPLGHVAPAGQRGDIVRVTDGAATVYLDPAEYETASEASLRAMLTVAGPRGEVPTGAGSVDPASTGPDPAGARPGSAGAGRATEADPEARPRRHRRVPEPIAQNDAAGSLNDPRRAGRRAQSIW